MLKNVHRTVNLMELTGVRNALCIGMYCLPMYNAQRHSIEEIEMKRVRWGSRTGVCAAGLD